MWLIVIGSALQGLGTLLAFIGLWRTWVRFADEPVWMPARSWMQGVRATVRRAVIRVATLLHVRRPAAVVVNAGGASLTFSAEISGVGTVHPPLPEDHGEALKFLYGLVVDHVGDERAEWKRIDRSMAEVARSVEAQQQQCQADINGLRNATNRVAVDGLRLQAVGLCLVLAGMVVSLAGAIATTR